MENIIVSFKKIILLSFWIRSGESLKMEIISSTEAILTYEDGTTEKITREYSNVDNPLVSRIDPSKFTYYYFQTTYYDTNSRRFTKFSTWLI